MNWQSYGGFYHSLIKMPGMKDFMRRHFQRETTHQPPCHARPCSPSIEICERPYHNTKVVILLRAFLSTILLHTDAITGYVLRQ